MYIHIYSHTFTYIWKTWIEKENKHDLLFHHRKKPIIILSILFLMEICLTPRPALGCGEPPCLSDSRSPPLSPTSHLWEAWPFCVLVSCFSEPLVPLRAHPRLALLAGCSFSFSSCKGHTPRSLLGADFSWGSIARMCLSCPCSQVYFSARLLTQEPSSNSSAAGCCAHVSSLHVLAPPALPEHTSALKSPTKAMWRAGRDQRVLTVTLRKTAKAFF